MAPQASRALVALWFLGCTGSHAAVDPDAGGGPAQPLEDRVCALWAERTCAAALGCCDDPFSTPALGDYGSEAACVPGLLERCAELYATLRVAEQELGTISVSDAALATLFVELEGASFPPCGAVPSPLREDVVIRRQALGDPCTTLTPYALYDCADGVCAPAADGVPRCMDEMAPDLGVPIPLCHYM